MATGESAARLPVPCRAQGTVPAGFPPPANFDKGCRISRGVSLWCCMAFTAEDFMWQIHRVGPCPPLKGLFVAVPARYSDILKSCCPTDFELGWWLCHLAMC